MKFVYVQTVNDKGSRSKTHLFAKYFEYDEQHAKWVGPKNNDIERWSERSYAMMTACGFILEGTPKIRTERQLDCSNCGSVRHYLKRMTADKTKEFLAQYVQGA